MHAPATSNNECHPGHDESSKLITSEAIEQSGKEFAVYPVPAKSVLNVFSKERTTVTLIDQSGKRLIQKNILGNSQINISHLAPGVYYLKNTSSGEIRKVIIAN